MISPSLALLLPAPVAIGRVPALMCSLLLHLVKITILSLKINLFCITQPLFVFILFRYNLTLQEGITSSVSYFPVDFSKGERELDLIELTIYTSIPNIETGINDKFYYGEDKSIAIPGGSYNIYDMETFKLSKLPKEVKLHYNLTITL